jgi:hypothetical protein
MIGFIYHTNKLANDAIIFLIQSRGIGWGHVSAPARELKPHTRFLSLTL